jgi:predicted nucleotidyltransferase
MRAHLARRFAAAEQDALARAERLRAELPRLARVLHERGARRVVLFGSLAPGGRPHAESDIDLSVEGLETGVFRACAHACLDAVTEAQVDLVRWEDAPPGLRAEIDFGVELPHVSG